MTDTVVAGRVATLADIEAPPKIDYARTPGFTEGTVLVLQSLTSGDMIDWSEANEGEAKREAGLRLIIKSIVDGEPGVDPGATGARLMNDRHVAMLRNKKHKDTESVVRAILDLNGMSLKKAEEVKKD